MISNQQSAPSLDLASRMAAGERGESHQSRYTIWRSDAIGAVDGGWMSQDKVVVVLIVAVMLI